jgi:hypothetical protein
LISGAPLEIRSTRPAGEVLQAIRDGIDPLRWGRVDGPGDADFVGVVDAPRFQVRERSRFWSLRRLRPTARGTVTSTSGGSIIQAGFRGVALYRLFVLIVTLAVFMTAAFLSVGSIESIVILVIGAASIALMESSKRSVREFLMACAAEGTPWRMRSAASG